ncbi:TetR/AcrR family transcriptional regulator [Amycolatopsis saalfeldensis]|uniref:DNA-binding transcriptional regulator, AcrR family n=1 Tax=Amycolatopsis saalfeldensis TaxID=394193 RepID=A0A1H8YP74_9PSEU|nr:TetR/AcrR family transcriptional regulator [Amycolatopsis saalfeldensis]SEP53893.1 DNA-binding transcriptional regulator, AcrR family [Amycolatopsis saalfeldensis]
MPRLSTERRDQRRRHVLVSAWSCFSRDGFHATSMDDIIAATGMSSSAVYRYFRSKDELIEASAEEALTLLSGFVARTLDTEPTPGPAEVLAGLLGELANRTAGPDYDLSKIAMHSWSEALRRSDVAKQTNAFYRGVHGHLTALAVRWKAAGHLLADAAPEDVATVLVALMPGLVVNQHLLDPVPAEQLIAGLAALGAAAGAG